MSAYAVIDISNPILEDSAFDRVALRCERTKRNLASIGALTAEFILVKSVHTA